MAFNSSLFLLYFLPFFLLIYYIIKDNYKNSYIVLASLLFYLWGAPKFLLILVVSIIGVYYLGKLIYFSSGKKRKFFFVLSLILNLSLLVYFKYYNFFISNLNSILENIGIHKLLYLRVVLPLGISFYVFHEMSYLIDVYRNKKPPLKKITDFALYILFFPKLIAGPIVRYSDMQEQIINRGQNENIDNRLIGLFRFIIGLAKKVLIANVLAQQADIIFAIPKAELSTSLAWLGILAYSFQIYFDFSGYSDMAIGLSRMLGFILPENFNNPYVSQSITEFWKRWHISLSMWFREYLFLPLAYKLSKKLPRERYWNIKTDYLLYLYAAIITFTLCGFWHNAQWTFVFWGLYQGFFIVIDRLFLMKLLKKTGKITRIIITFLIINIGWVFFRSKTFTGAFLYIKKMFVFDFRASSIEFDNKFVLIFILTAFFVFWGAFKRIEAWQNRLFIDKPKLFTIFTMSIICIFLFILSLSSITSTGFKPFIYFRF